VQKLKLDWFFFAVHDKQFATIFMDLASLCHVHSSLFSKRIEDDTLEYFSGH